MFGNCKSWLPYAMDLSSRHRSL
uniref:Uncharacterized protein n=1 Tax=Rhizophora mucronata TaxID=61149 RepID=A0A2P2N7M3_RHIMU